VFCLSKTESKRGRPFVVFWRALEVSVLARVSEESGDDQLADRDSQGLLCVAGACYNDAREHYVSSGFQPIIRMF
jgi:hypothetical protein